MPLYTSGPMERVKTSDDDSHRDVKSDAILRPSVLSKTLLMYLQSLTDNRRELILDFHREHSELIHASRGSQTKHQAWTGGYVDHLAEIFRIAEASYAALNSIRSLPFSLDQALIVLYFHDIEKIWKYTKGLPKGFDKDRYFDVTLREKYGITFSANERNALHYIHGEPDAEYDPLIRKAGPLAAFCHAADILSARMWFDEGKGLGV